MIKNIATVAIAAALFVACGSAQEEPANAQPTTPEEQIENAQDALNEKVDELNAAGQEAIDTVNAKVEEVKEGINEVKEAVGH